SPSVLSTGARRHRRLSRVGPGVRLVAAAVRLTWGLHPAALILRGWCCGVAPAARFQWSEESPQSARRSGMTIGPVQLLVLGFDHPDFQGKIRAELQRLRDTDMVRVIDFLAVYKAVGGDVAVLKESQLD